MAEELGRSYYSALKLADSMWDLKVLVVLRKRIIITSKVDADEP